VAQQLTISVSLAQIGEFAFILAGLGISLGLLSDEGRNLVLAAAQSASGRSGCRPGHSRR
jgi:predicted Kef-type K+ transport protein